MAKKILFAIACIISLVAGGYAGKMSTSLDLINEDRANKLSDVDLGDISVTSDTDVINILLIGADKRQELGSETWGRSDTVMIATIDNKHNCLKLTSLMRDMDVYIPEYGNHKFNAAYAFGGPELLYKTIAYNFGVSLDGYAEVDFDAFRQIINKIGGVEIEITEGEAQYLNTTNYIKGKKNRNLVPGWNKMNGAQALGYCRIRARANINGTNNDQGRTERQRMVMKAAFEKVKKMPMSKWQDIINVVMPNVTTDISSSQILSYAMNVVTLGTTELNSYRVPVEGYYRDGSDADGDCLILNLEDNKLLLQQFIFDYNGEGPMPGEKTDETTTESAGGY